MCVTRLQPPVWRFGISNFPAGTRGTCVGGRAGTVPSMAGDACGFDSLNDPASQEKPARPSAPGRASEQARMRVNAERDRCRKLCRSAPEKTLNAQPRK